MKLSNYKMKTVELDGNRGLEWNGFGAKKLIYLPSQWNKIENISYCECELGSYRRLLKVSCYHENHIIGILIL